MGYAHIHRLDLGFYSFGGLSLRLVGCLCCLPNSICRFAACPEAFWLVCLKRPQKKRAANGDNPLENFMEGCPLIRHLPPALTHKMGFTLKDSKNLNYLLSQAENPALNGHLPDYWRHSPDKLTILTGLPLFLWGKS